MQRFHHLGIPESDLGALDLIVVQRRYVLPTERGFLEKRSVTEVCEIVSGKNGIELNELYSMDWKKRELVERNDSVRVFEKANQSMQWNFAQFKQAVSKKAKEWKKNARKKASSELDLDWSVKK